MKKLFCAVLDLLMVISGAIFLMIILTSLFIGSGYIISVLYKFTLFNATALSIGVTFAFSCIVFMADYSRYEDSAKENLSMENDSYNCRVCTSRGEKLENKKLRRHKLSPDRSPSSV